LRNRVMKNNILKSVTKAMQREEEEELLNCSDVSLSNISIIGKNSSVSLDNTDATSFNGGVLELNDENDSKISLELSPQSTPKKYLNNGFEQSIDEGGKEEAVEEEDTEGTGEMDLSFYRYLDAQKTKIKNDAEEARRELENKVENIGKTNEFENKLLESPTKIEDNEKVKEESEAELQQNGTTHEFENNTYDNAKNVSLFTITSKDSIYNEEETEDSDEEDLSFYRYLDAQKKNIKEEAEEAKRKLKKKVEKLSKDCEKSKVEQNGTENAEHEFENTMYQSTRRASLRSSKTSRPSLQSNKRKAEDSEPANDAEERDLSFYRYLGAQEKKAKQDEFSDEMDISTAEDIGSKVNTTNGMLSLSMFNVSNLFETSEQKPENVKEEKVAVKGLMKSKSMAKIMKVGSAMGNAIWGIPYTNVVEDQDTSIAVDEPASEETVSKLEESPETLESEGCSKDEDKKSGRCIIS